MFSVISLEHIQAMCLSHALGTPTKDAKDEIAVDGRQGKTLEFSIINGTSDELRGIGIKMQLNNLTNVLATNPAIVASQRDLSGAINGALPLPLAQVTIGPLHVETLCFGFR